MPLPIVMPQSSAPSRFKIAWTYTTFTIALCCVALGLDDPIGTVPGRTRTFTTKEPGTRRSDLLVDVGTSDSERSENDSQGPFNGISDEETEEFLTSARYWRAGAVVAENLVFQKAKFYAPLVTENMESYFTPAPHGQTVECLMFRSLTAMGYSVDRYWLTALLRSHNIPVVAVEPLTVNADGKGSGSAKVWVTSQYKSTILKLHHRLLVDRVDGQLGVWERVDGSIVSDLYEVLRARQATRVASATFSQDLPEHLVSVEVARGGDQRYKSGLYQPGPACAGAPAEFMAPAMDCYTPSIRVGSVAPSSLPPTQVPATRANSVKVEADVPGHKGGWRYDIYRHKGI